MRIKQWTGKGSIIADVCYRPPNQEEQVNEALYRQVGTASHLKALVLMQNFKHPDICWRDNTVRHKQSRRFLECIGDKFLLQITEKRTR